MVILSGRLFPENSRSTPKKTYRNPVIYARELHQEMVLDCLTRKQLAERHDVSTDRITQWLCLLTLPEEKLLEIEKLGDDWDRQLVTERHLRKVQQHADTVVAVVTEPDQKQTGSGLVRLRAFNR